MKIKKYLGEHRLTVVFSFLLVGFSFLFLLFFCKDSDYFWHIKAGEYMFKNKEILTKDIFSWIVCEKYWMSHEWLFEVILYGLKVIFGDFHTFVYVFFNIFLLLFILFFTNRKSYLKNIPFSLVWVGCSLILLFFIQARPHMISYNLLALTIYLLYDLYKREESNKVYFLPLITVLWANVHGGSSNLSYLFCLLFIIVGLFKFKYSKIEANRITKKQLKKCILVMFLCMICTCFNPHGIKMFLYPYENMMNNLMISNISEWQPTVLSDFSHYPYFILVIGIVLIFLFSKRKIQFIDFSLLVVVVFLGLKSIRFWPYTYIVMSYVIFNYIGERKVDRGSCFSICLLSIILIMIFFVNYTVINRKASSTYLSKNVINVIKQVNPKRLFNMYDYGGQLIYNDISVFIDGRADLYSKYNYADYLKISMLDEGYVKLIDKYDFDYLLVDKTYPLDVFLKYCDDYDKIYSDKKVNLYKKRIQLKR